MLTRRSFLYRSTVSLLGLSGVARAQAGINGLVQTYMQTYDVPGLSLAYGRGPRIVYAQGYGWSNRRDKTQVSPQSLFRIASCSKSITSAAIYTLVQDGKLRTSDYVFGPRGILTDYSLRSQPDRLQAITVEHLLTHTAGGWGNEAGDPMFHTKENNRNRFLQHTLDSFPLSDPPGTAYAYSNFGYFVLGRVIEQVSGQPYEVYVREHVLTPLGVTDMRLAAKKAADDEVHYYGQGNDDPYAVPIELHDANGGWLATPSDLVHFALGVFSAEDKAGAPALFTAETLAKLTRGSAANPGYASGWGLSPEGDFSHSGGFDGTASFLVHRHDGLAWAILVNTRRAHSRMESDLHKLSWNIASTLTA